MVTEVGKVTKKDYYNRFDVNDDSANVSCFYYGPNGGILKNNATGEVKVHGTLPTEDEDILFNDYVLMSIVGEDAQSTSVEVPKIYDENEKSYKYRSPLAWALNFALILVILFGGIALLALPVIVKLLER